jgi:ribosomal protein S18 acetylase RimI-like enzyme
MSELCIRHAVESDAQFIAEYNRAMALETENKILDPETVIQGVKRVFQTPQYGFYLVAEGPVDSGGSSVVGCLLITYEWSDWRNGLFWWIMSVYVAPGARRKGVYRSLYQYARQLAGEDQNICGIRLYVDRENTRAQKTYASLGMFKTDYHLYETEFSKTC